MSVVLVVLVGSILWAAPGQAGAVVLLAEVPQDTEATPTDPEECDRFDYGCRVTVGVYLWIAGLIADLIEFALTLAALPALATPPPTDGLRMVWGEVLTISNSLYVLVVLVAGVLLMGYQTVQASTALKDVLPRIVFGFLAANSSWLLIEMMRELANAIAISMLDGAATVENVTETIARLFDSPRGEALIILVLMLVGSILSFFFMLAAIIRIVLWTGLTAISPLALACHALPQTEGLAKLWWRAMAALMIIQIAQGLVLRLMVTLFLSRDAMPDFVGAAQNVVDILMVICLMYVLVRIPFWAFRQVFNLQASPLVRGAKVAAGLLVFRGLRGLGKGRAGKGPTAKVPNTAQRPPAMRASSHRSTGVPPAPRWHQPELPHFTSRMPHRQDPLPGMDRRIDRRQQARLRERRRWHQPELPRPQNTPPVPQGWRQDALPQWQEPRLRQEMLPQARTLPPPRPRQDPLFPPPSDRRRRRS